VGLTCCMCHLLTLSAVQHYECGAETLVFVNESSNGWEAGVEFSVTFSTFIGDWVASPPQRLRLNPSGLLPTADS
jgi:hypothetical protein